MASLSATTSSGSDESIDRKGGATIDVETFRAVYAQSLIRCLFSAETQDDQAAHELGRMLSITATPDEISILADENTLKRFFPKDFLVTSQRLWVPLQVMNASTLVLL